MNQADILKLAEEAGFTSSEHFARVWPKDSVGYMKPSIALTRFAELVAQHERDACLKLAQDLADMYEEREYYRHPELRTDAETGLMELEEAIRARGSK